MMIRQTKLYMDTVVDLQIVIDNETCKAKAEKRMELAFDAFRKVEDACSRFTPDSELMIASQSIDEPVPVSPYLFQPLKFALEMAKLTEGLFDPSIGKALENLGYNRHYLTGERMTSWIESDVTYKDIILDEQAQTVRFKKPMVIDLGAVAKGFAVDLAAEPLRDFPGFIINAGGDLFAGGLDENGDKWKVGIQHPFEKDKLIEVVEVSNEAICTSGSYERKDDERPGQHHIIYPETQESPNAWISCSVIAPFAMLADAFSTAVFLIDSKSGTELIETIGGRGLFITPELKKVRVGGSQL